MKEASFVNKKIIKSILFEVIFVPRKYVHILYIFLFFTLDTLTHNWQYIKT